MKRVIIAMLFCLGFAGISAAQGNRSERSKAEQAARAAERESFKAELRAGAAQGDVHAAVSSERRADYNASQTGRDLADAARSGDRAKLDRAIREKDAADRRASDASRDVDRARDRARDARDAADRAKDRADRARDRADRPGGFRDRN